MLTMNVFVFPALLLAVFVTESCNARYTVQGNHWGEDKIEAKIKGMTQYAETMDQEWNNMLANKDAEDMVKKYTEDCVYARQGRRTAYGREEAKKLYQDWFDSGVANVNVELLRSGALGDEYMYIFAAVQLLDDNNDIIGNSRMLVIFKEVDGGFETFLKSETIDMK